MSWQTLLEFIVPPEGKAHSRQWYVWASIGLVSYWLFFWWSLGFAPEAFGEGFARAEDTKFNTQLLLEQRLVVAKRSQCMASDAESLAYWAGEINRLLTLYAQKVGISYHEPPCSALVPDASE